MIKYILKNLPLPMDMVNEIYSFIDPLRQIKNLPPIWYKRLIGREFQLYADFGPTFLKHLFKNEEAMLSINSCLFTLYPFFCLKKLTNFKSSPSKHTAPS